MTQQFYRIIIEGRETCIKCNNKHFEAMNAIMIHIKKNKNEETINNRPQTKVQWNERNYESIFSDCYRYVIPY